MPMVLTVSANTEPLKHSSLLFGLAPPASKARHNANTGDRLRTTMSPACAVSSPISCATITAPFIAAPTEADEPPCAAFTPCMAPPASMILRAADRVAAVERVSVEHHLGEGHVIVHDRMVRRD